MAENEGDSHWGSAPDLECRVVDCDNRADGRVEDAQADMKIPTCVGCATSFLEHDGFSWRRYAGGRRLQESDTNVA